MPSEKAEGIETAKLCEALAKKLQVILIYPGRRNDIKEDIFDYYSIRRNFLYKKIPSLNFGFLGDLKIFFYIQIISFALLSIIYSFFAVKKDDFIFTHDTYLAFIFSLFRKNVVFDMHDFPRTNLRLHNWFFKKLAGITTTNKWKMEQLINNFGIEIDKIIYQPNGVDLEKFAIKIDKLQSRKDTNLPQNVTLVEYVGMLRTMGMKKGVDVMLQALKMLPGNIVALFVGGHKGDIEYYVSLAKSMGLEKRAIFVGWVKHSDIPKYLCASDILVAPFPKNEHYEHYMCPMKVIEYMASGRPMVVSDLESIREIVDDSMAYFFLPGDAVSLANSILEVLKFKDISNKKAQESLKKAELFSWDERAFKIVKFLSSLRTK